MAQVQEPEAKRDMARRLEDLFDESKAAAEEFGGSRAVGEFPLRGLKALILSLDWEISDDTLNKLTDEVETLKTVFKNDKVLLLFFQLLDSVGRYLKANKEKSHPDAVRLLNSIYVKLDKVYQAGDMPQEGRKRILLLEIRKFKALKARIAERKARAVPPLITSAETGKKATQAFQQDQAYAAGPKERASDLQTDDMTPQEALAAAVEEIKKAIRIEFEALRLELRSR